MNRPGIPLGVAMVAACPFPADHGSAASIREMSQALARRGHRIHIVTYPTGQPIPVDGVTIHRVPGVVRPRAIRIGPTASKPLLDLLLVGTLVRCVRREGIDVIHAHNYEAAIAGWIARRLTGRPLLYNGVNTMEDELPSYGFIRPRMLAVRLARWLDRTVPRGADQVTVVSEELRAFLEARGVAPERITLVPAGVNPEMFGDVEPAEARRRLGLGPERIVLYTGTLDRFQRVDYLIRAMTRVVAAVPESRLVLATNIAREEDVARTRREAADAGLEDVVRLRTSTLEDLPALLAAADVAVCPRPACPGFPVKVLNYMAARKAIVTARGSAKGLRHMEQAFVAEDHDWEGLADGIVALLRDRGEAERMGRNARAFIDGRFDWPSLAERIEGVYGRMVGAAAPPSAPSRSARLGAGR